MRDLYIRDNKLTSKYNSFLDVVTGYKDVQIKNVVYLDVPVIKRMNRKEFVKMLFNGILLTVFAYAMIVLTIGLAPMHVVS